MKKQIARLLIIILILGTTIVTKYDNKVYAEESGYKLFKQGRHIYMQYPNGDIYASGSNSGGQLGVGYDSSRQKGFVRAIGLPTDTSIKNAYVSRYKKFSVILMDDGTVYAAGEGLKAEAGYADETQYEWNKVNIDTVTQMTNNSDNVYFLKQNGDIWTIGGEYTTSLSSGVPVNPVALTQCTQYSNIEKLWSWEIGPSYIMTSKTGEVFMSGMSNSYYTIIPGHTSTNEFHREPVLINGISNVKDVKINQEDYWFLTDNGDVYYFGKNKKGYANPDKQPILNPVLVDTDIIEFSLFHRLKSNGDLYRVTSTGVNLLCNINSSISKVSNFIELNNNSLVLLSDSGELYAIGYNYYGAFGLPSVTQLDSLTKLKDNIKYLKKMYTGLAYLDQSDNLFVSGFHKAFNSDSGDTKNFTMLYENVKDYIFEYNYQFVTTKDNKFYLKGYNEVGEMGLTSSSTYVSTYTILDLNVVELKDYQSEQSMEKIVPKPTLNYSAGTFTENDTNDGSLKNSIIITLDNDTFTGSNSDDLILQGKVTISNVPGLTAHLIKDSDTQATLTFSGNATDHENIHDASNITLSLSNSAFSGDDASIVENSTKNDITIDFMDLTAISYSTTNMSEAIANDGTITDTITLSLTGNTFTGTDGRDLIADGDVNITAVNGLDAQMIKNNDNQLTLSYMGNAAAHSLSDTQNISINFNQTSFTNSEDAHIQNKTQDITLSFMDNPNISFSASQFKENIVSNDGTISNSIEVRLQGDTFTGTISDDIIADLDVIGTIPNGLTLKATKSSDTVLLLTLEGAALAHSNTDNVSLTINLKDSAFTSLTSSDILGTNNNTIAIEFMDQLTRAEVIAAIEKAELSELRSDYTTAKELYDLLIDPTKSDLLDRIKHVQVEVNLIEAEQLVINAETTKNDADIAVAQVKLEFIDSLIQMLPADPTASLFEEVLCTLGLSMKTYAATTHSKTTSLSKYYEQKARLDALKYEVDPTATNLDNAKDSISKVTDTDLKNDLENKTSNAETIATNLVQKAKDSKTVVDYYEALDFVENLSPSATKDNLKAELKTLRETLIAEGKIKADDNVYDYIEDIENNATNNNGSGTQVVYVEKDSNDSDSSSNNTDPNPNHIETDTKVEVVKEINETIKDLKDTIESKDTIINELLKDLKDSVVNGKYDEAQEVAQEYIEQVKKENEQLKSVIKELMDKYNENVDAIDLVKKAEQNGTTIEIETLKLLLDKLDLTEDEVKKISQKIIELEAKLKLAKSVQTTIVNHSTSTGGNSNTVINNESQKKLKGITLFIDNEIFTLDYNIDKEIKMMDTEPFIENERTLVPIRFIAENLGAAVEWDQKNNHAIVQKDNMVVKFIIGSNKVIINNQEAIIDTNSVIKDNRTFIPARLVSELFGYDVKWDSALRRVVIEK